MSQCRIVQNTDINSKKNVWESGAKNRQFKHYEIFNAFFAVKMVIKVIIKFKFNKNITMKIEALRANVQIDSSTEN